MACNNDKICIERETTDEIRDRLALGISSNILDNEPLVDGQPLHILSAIIAGALFEAKGDVIKEHYNIDPTNLCCDEFFEWGKLRGIYAKPPEQAHGFIKITGNAGSAIPSDIEFVGENSTEYTLDPLYENPVQITADETAVLKVRAKEPGISGNTETNLQLLASVPEIDFETETLGNGIVGGADQETCEQLKARVKERQTGIPRAENNDWYRDTILSYPGVTRVCFSVCCSKCCDDIPRPYVFMDGIYDYGIPPCEIMRDIALFVWGNPMGSGNGKAAKASIGIIGKPEVAFVDVKVNYKGQITSQIRENVRAYIDSYFKNGRCLDEDLCISDFIAGISNGFTGCIQSVELSGDQVIQVDLDVAFECGHFPVLDSLEFCKV